MSIRKNVAGQKLFGVLVHAGTGAAITSGATIKIGASDGSGTLSYLAGGLWEYTLTQAETNADSFGYVFGGTNVIPVGGTVITVEYPRNALPNAAAEAAGGLITRGTGTGQLNLLGGGIYLANDNQTTKRLRLAPDGTNNALELLGASSGTAGGHGLVIQGGSGSSLAGGDGIRIGAGASDSGAGQPVRYSNTELLSALWAHASRTLSSDGVQAIWDFLLTAISVTGSIGKKIKDWALGSDNRALVSVDAHTSGQTVASITDKSDYALSSAAQSALVAAIEAEIADDATGEAIKQAIIDKLLENLPDIDDLTLSAIADSVRAEIMDHLISGVAVSALLAKLNVSGTLSTLDAAGVWAHGERTLTSAANITSTGGTITVNAGKVTVGTNDDKTGYSLSGTLQTLDALDASLSATHGSGSWTTATGFSTAAKMVAYFRLLARKDAAVAADHAAELTEINANGGSGGGGFNNANDSTEAIRDRGDAAWTTGAGGGGGEPLENEEPVDHNTGGEDALRFMLGGAGIDNAEIRAFLKLDYDAGIRPQLGESRTGPDGRWLRPINLNKPTGGGDPIEYVLTFVKPGVTQVSTAVVTLQE